MDSLAADLGGGRKKWAGYCGDCNLHLSFSFFEEVIYVILISFNPSSRRDDGFENTVIHRNVFPAQKLIRPSIFVADVDTK